MSELQFLRLKSLNVKSMHGVSSAKNVIKVAAMHNLREIVAEFGVRADSHIDLARIALNYQLRGPATAAGVADLALALLDNAGVKKLRKDACMALEVVFSLPPGSAVHHREFFGAAVAWADSFFNVPILSAAVHLDESVPHCHVLLLPLVCGRMRGGALAGGPTKIKMMLSDFQQQVGQRFGLAHRPRAKRLSKVNRDAAGRKVLDLLKAHPDRFKVPAVRDALIVALGQHHETLLPLLGLDVSVAPGTKGKSFAAIMTAPCKPERGARAHTSAIDIPKPISIDVGTTRAEPDTPDFNNVYLCVDVAPLAPAFALDIAHHSNTPANAQRLPSGTDKLASESEQRSALEDAAPTSISTSETATRQATSAATAHVDQATQQCYTAPAEAPASAIARSSPLAARHDARKTDHRTAPQRGAIERHGPGSATAERAPFVASAATDGDYERQRDDDEHTAFWDPERGEFAKPLIKASGRELAETAVQNALQRQASRQTGERTRVGDAKSHNELLESHYGKRMDPRAKSKASSID